MIKTGAISLSAVIGAFSRFLVPGRYRTPGPPHLSPQVVAISAALGLIASAPATAAPEGIVQHLPGDDLSIAWAIPFVGLLLSIAVLPLVTPGFWHHHYGKVGAGWVALLAIPLVSSFGLEVATYELLHAMLLEYVPFIVVLFALYVISGGILVEGKLTATPVTNTALLGFGTAIASVTGTTGASIVLIRPLLRANLTRRHNVHVFVFFIFLVSNIGGSLTPLGDPPLFIGFLKGVDFFWPAQALWQPALLLSACLLAIFFLLDSRLAAREEPRTVGASATSDGPIKLKGWLNVGLLLAVTAAILASVALPIVGEVSIGHVTVDAASIFRVLSLLGLASLSLMLTPLQFRDANSFTWAPITEVAKLFAAIFITIVPVIAMLKSGSAGPFAGLLALVSYPDGSPNNLSYFWVTGGLSSFLDNAPTYLVFFNVAGGDAQMLMGPMHQTLTAISAGAVFMGAMTYIGNAPNFMVKAIAEEAGVKMPSFFGYMAWSGAVLLPLLLLTGAIYFV